MNTLAAVLVETGKPLELVELEIPQLRAGQVLVEVSVSGVCKTQILEARGYRGEDRFLPHCLGHEASGIVRELGPNVTKVEAGQAVVLSWIQGSGANVPGSVYAWGDRKVNAGAVTTFSRLAVVSENRLWTMPDGLQDWKAALLGCAVATGMGAVLNTARLEPGQSAVVFGVGGVGMCAIVGAAAAGGGPVVAVDIDDKKLEIARKLGATHTVNANDSGAARDLGDIVKGGFDVAVEASGQPAVMARALECVRMRGGRAVVIGNARHGQHVQVDPMQLNMGKSLLGTWGGDTVPDRDFPRYVELLRKVDLRPLVERRYSLSQINQALDDLEQGRALRPMIDLKAGA